MRRRYATQSMNPTDRILKVDVVGRVWKPGEQREAVLDEFPLVPRVSAALWERMRGAKLRFCGRRVSMVGSFRGRRARMGDGVSPGSTFPKRCANFGNERQTRGKSLFLITSCGKGHFEPVFHFDAAGSPVAHHVPCGPEVHDFQAASSAGHGVGFNHSECETGVPHILPARPAEGRVVWLCPCVGAVPALAGHFFSPDGVARG